MAKKNVHRRNRISRTDSSSSKDDEFKEVFIWIDSDLKDVFEMDVKITWAEQKNNIVTKLLPALRKLVDKRYKVTNKELLDMLYGRWRSRHREYNIRIQGEEKIKSNKRRTTKNSKMQDKKKRRVIATNYLIQNNDKYINRYPKEDLVNILKETGYHSEEWEEKDPESEWPVVIPVVIEKIREQLNPDDDPDEIDPNDLELWLKKDLTIKEALRLLLHKRTDPTVNLLKTKQATLKYKRIDGYVQETGMPPIGAPS
ncbi:hypothetical protein GLOIN_2v1474511 [Rhizophagus irregularis DAOM 181602=DAOM 197198]|uniref:Uncharacterized protein n=1 Tax=Rhizophagus irregularis (strain DAOM 181602 / DAOM 197198 / MUCL 43194) TaxID=747089 RepID=A0A2P4QGB2_RHIID|nr:hypothetical protein GLOIN_2v1474511 [Rhizophagus irregularis DAOM 181602=DAOM 197198]POG76679.1 hypothetical protein GLOIN_2v1474511 [Rhizophagus irregularis DAOM 181602=DAOM 197198]|eukprot:XP_025183545.1 hypothetical protein GLOIN_2v1474511 [Rhizophagus irregularis DAOM 181602=DAOM 197198]